MVTVCLVFDNGNADPPIRRTVGSRRIAGRIAIDYASKPWNRIRCETLRSLLIAAGGCGIVFFSAVDLVHLGSPGLGPDQLAGIVVSIIVMLSGLRDPARPHIRLWFGGLLLLYVAVMLVMGLKPMGHTFHGTRRLLDASGPQAVDFIINVVGFAPFAYLCMAFLYRGSKPSRLAGQARWVVAAGFLISLFIEVMQYDIPGRSSSLTDVIANTIGAAIGVAGFIFEYRRCCTPAVDHGADDADDTCGG